MVEARISATVDLLMCFFVLWGLRLACNKAVVSLVPSLTLSHLFFVAYCYGFRPQAAQWQNTSQILSLHDPAQQQSYTCTHVEQTRMVGCSLKVICPGCSVSLWVIVCVCGFFCAFAAEDTWEWVFAYVRPFTRVSSALASTLRVRGHVAAGSAGSVLTSGARNDIVTVGTVTSVDTQIWVTAIGPPGLIITSYYCARALWVVGLD